MSLEFCIPIEQLVYTTVNKRNIHNTRPTLSPTTKQNLKKLNWPDFLLYEAISELQNRKLKFYSQNFGADYISSLVDEIRKKSKKISDECIDYSAVPNHAVGAEQTIRTVVMLKEEKIKNVTCQRLQFQGPPTSRLLQVRQFDRIFRSVIRYTGNSVLYELF